MREAASVFVPLQVVTAIFFAEADAHEYVLWALWSALALSLKIAVLLTRERFVRVRCSQRVLVCGEKVSHLRTSEGFSRCIRLPCHPKQNIRGLVSFAPRTHRIVFE